MIIWKVKTSVFVLIYASQVVNLCLPTKSPLFLKRVLSEASPVNFLIDIYQRRKYSNTYYQLKQ